MKLSYNYAELRPFITYFGIKTLLRGIESLFSGIRSPFCGIESPLRGMKSLLTRKKQN